MQSRSSRRSVLLASVSAIPLAASGLAAAQSRFKIEGTVTTSSGRPVPGVVVKIDRPGTPSVSTNASGIYGLGIDGGPPIGQLSYSHTNFDYAVIENLSGDRSQNISKVLYARGEKRPAVAVVDTLGAYEQLLVALLVLPPGQRQSVADDYRKANWIAFLSELPMPDAGEATAWLGSRQKELVNRLQRALG